MHSIVHLHLFAFFNRVHMCHLFTELLTGGANAKGSTIVSTEYGFEYV